jgi:hypothetical protein
MHQRRDAAASPEQRRNLRSAAIGREHRAMCDRQSVDTGSLKSEVVVDRVSSEPVSRQRTTIP